ncbi:MAG: tRNA (N6-threonylcarbamoyladenosine(37)-N6)-methyltransferase TrmO [Tannerella sp.]|jgi:tRNA-Thr(GGU) m(6)t(6)A37 methyltransferase TsaA|nr:tRNA (N6-threonylcarbamoyladenosine(37)-N6)-methyltransferase TrmO [Tannerella sp.]
MNQIVLEPIGVIHTPHEQIEGMPVQPAGAAGFAGKAVLKKEYAGGLTDLEGFSHMILVYHFHQTEGYLLHPIPFMDTKPHGVFATRSPKRPNHIGMSTVRILSVEDGTVAFDGADMLDGTPLIDIKPYYPKYDSPSDTKSGWLDKAAHAHCSHVRSDNRFV